MYAVWIGGTVMALLMIALVMLWLIGFAEAGGENTVPEGSPDETQHTIDTSSTVDELRSEADVALETAVAAKENNNFDETIHAYSEALSKYQAALDKLDAGAAETRAEIEASIDSTRDDLEVVKNLYEKRKELIGLLETAEHDFQVAIVAYAQGSQTLARIRFRQARDSFTDAVERITNSDHSLLTPPVDVSVEPDRELASNTLSKYQPSQRQRLRH
jgi:tetratricopeptide (TPR) repeat protein